MSHTLIIRSLKNKCEYFDESVKQCDWVAENDVTFDNVTKRLCTAHTVHTQEIFALFGFSLGPAKPILTTAEIKNELMLYRQLHKEFWDYRTMNRTPELSSPKIAAIMYVKKEFDVSLKEAKTVTDRIWAETRPSVFPESCA